MSVTLFFYLFVFCLYLLYCEINIHIKNVIDDIGDKPTKIIVISCEMVRKYVSDIVTEKLGYSLLKLSQKRYNTHTSLQKPRIFFPKQQLI